MSARISNLVLPAAVAAVQLLGTIVAARHQSEIRRLDASGLALLLTGPVSFSVLARRPWVALAATVTSLETYLALNYPLGPVFLSLVVALVNATLSGRRRAVALTVLAFLAGALVARAAGAIGWPQLTGATAWTLTVVSVAEVARSRRDALAQARAVAEADSLRRAGEERLSIAREVHDVLAHSLSLISVQAGVGLHLFDEQPEQARQALRTVKDASAEGLRDLRRTVDVLRDGAATAPTPGLDDLGRLFDTVRATGVEISCSEEGERREVDAPVGLAAYRVVQESLTNVSRHSRSVEVRVLLHWWECTLEVVVDDDGPTTDTAGTTRKGHGLDGMRERVSALGGDLETGPTPGGGFHVRATLPA